MPAIQCALRVERIARQWHDLAERRVVYYNELYRSGRWQRYFRTREQFAQRMLDVIAVAKAFSKLTGDTPPLSSRQDDLRAAA
jgi:hypothetical protein